jgi:D-citramalate synthase
MDALRKIASANNISLPELLDYQVRIPPGGKTSALVETIITWSGSAQNNQTDSFRTIGLDSDQISAAILATEKMLNLILK